MLFPIDEITPFKILIFLFPPPIFGISNDRKTRPSFESLFNDDNSLAMVSQQSW